MLLMYLIARSLVMHVWLGCWNAPPNTQLLCWLLLFACRYGMRFVAMKLRQSLQNKFPDATREEILKVTGG